MKSLFVNTYTITQKQDASQNNTNCNIYLNYDGKNKSLPRNYNMTNYNFIFNYIPNIVVPYITRKNVTNDVG